MERPLTESPAIMEELNDELDARAKFKLGDKVYWQAVGYTIAGRFWRRAEDAFYYNLREIARPGTYPDMPKKVPEEELETD
jgi:hypothetical protein